MSSERIHDRSRFPLVASALGGAGALALFAAIRRRNGDGVGAPELSKPQPASTHHDGDDAAFVGPAPTNDVEALARVLASEVGNPKRYTTSERLVVGWTVRNRARHRHVSIVQLVCSPTCGRCCKGRPFSSFRAPSQADLDLAGDILSRRQSDDPTSGARAFFEPALEDWLAAHGDHRHHRTADQVRAAWLADGQKKLGSVGRIELWS